MLITRHGPIITDIVPGEKRPLALKWVIYDPSVGSLVSLMLIRPGIGRSSAQLFRTSELRGKTSSMPMLRDTSHFGDVAHADRVAGLLAHDQVADLRRVGHAPVDAHRELAGPGVDAAAGRRQVLAGDRALHVDDGHAAPRRRMGSSDDVDLPLAPAEQLHLARRRRSTRAARRTRLSASSVVSRSE